jgi:hypothetical protein
MQQGQPQSSVREKGATMFWWQNTMSWKDSAFAVNSLLCGMKAKAEAKVQADFRIVVQGSEATLFTSVLQDAHEGTQGACPPPVVSIFPTNITVGYTTQAQASNCANFAKTWTSSSPGVAAVNPLGMVTGVSPGIAVISVSCGDPPQQGHLPINVSEPMPEPPSPGTCDDPFTDEIETDQCQDNGGDQPTTGSNGSTFVVNVPAPGGGTKYVYACYYQPMKTSWNGGYSWWYWEQFEGCFWEEIPG